LRVGEQSQGGGLALVEGAGVAEPGQDAGQVADGGPQVQRVEGVQAGGEVGGGGGGAVVEPDPAGVQGGLLDAGGPVGVAAQLASWTSSLSRPGVRVQFRVAITARCRSTKSTAARDRPVVRAATWRAFQA
jgi:hypothetical protein